MRTFKEDDDHYKWIDAIIVSSSPPTSPRRQLQNEHLSSLTLCEYSFYYN